CQKYISPPFTF
nr:immunoglobulin light chain junction region [Macaca mulatta]MOV78511.1 immunoglobulin light chain junction region [Macaca mulatta]